MAVLADHLLKQDLQIRQIPAHWILDLEVEEGAYQGFQKIRYEIFEILNFEELKRNFSNR